MPTIPDPISRLNSFTAFQQAQGDNSFPGTQIDADLDQTNNVLDALIAAVRLVIRADGVLANGSVPRSALAADVMLGLGASRPWSGSTAYAKNDTVTRGYGLYVALTANSGADPLTSASWALQADLSQAVIVADGSITTAKLPDRAVTEPKQADGSASTRVLADGAVTRAKAALNLGVMPVGAETGYAGIRLPAGWLWCAGQEVSRTGYADLFQAVTIEFLADSTLGSGNVYNVSVPLTGLGLVGSLVEGPGIAAGTILFGDDAGTIVFSKPVTSSSVQGRFRILPWGRGNGSTTFNVPDRRGIVTAGRDNMNGSAAGRLTQPFDGRQLTSSGGATQITLGNQNLPASLPGGSVTVNFPSYSGVKYSGPLATASGGAGGVNVPNLWQNTEAYTLTPSATSGNFAFGIGNPGGGQAFAAVQPTGVANVIIFAGV